MSYLRTVLTYHQPSEAEVDKAFLESEGITVCLLNANTSRNELGAPFFVRLQVADEEYARAVELLKASNPQRFGSEARVAEIEKELFQNVVRFSVSAIICAAVGALLTMDSDMQAPVAISSGILGGLASLYIRKLASNRKC